MTIESKTETPGGSRQVVTVDAFTLHADVTTPAGGPATAPAPHDYFDTALATCKALTATVYARSRGYALERVEARVTRDDSRERQGHYVLNVELEYFGALSDEEKAKIHEVLQRCPIHKLMTTTEIEIVTAPLALARSASQ